MNPAALVVYFVALLIGATIPKYAAAMLGYVALGSVAYQIHRRFFP